MADKNLENLFESLSVLDRWIDEASKEKHTFNFVNSNKEKPMYIPFITMEYDDSGNTSLFSIDQKKLQEKLFKIKSDALKKALNLAVEQRKIIKKLLKERL